MHLRRLVSRAYFRAVAARVAGGALCLVFRHSLESRISKCPANCRYHARRASCLDMLVSAKEKAADEAAF